jgi:outer membrane murein-binding lipoprotein Lpp
MMIFSWLNAYKNVLLIAIGAAVVGLIFTAGIRHEARKHEAATARVNLPIVEARGRDEAEIAANDQAAKVADAAVAAGVTQTCPLNAPTAKLLAEVR